MFSVWMWKTYIYTIVQLGMMKMCAVMHTECIPAYIKACSCKQPQDAQSNVWHWTEVHDGLCVIVVLLGRFILSKTKKIHMYEDSQSHVWISIELHFLHFGQTDCVYLLHIPCGESHTHMSHDGHGPNGIQKSNSTTCGKPPSLLFPAVCTRSACVVLIYIYMYDARSTFRSQCAFVSSIQRVEMILCNRTGPKHKQWETRLNAERAHQVIYVDLILATTWQTGQFHGLWLPRLITAH